MKTSIVYCICQGWTGVPETRDTDVIIQAFQPSYHSIFWVLLSPLVQNII